MKTNLFVVISLAALMICSSSFGDDWSQFRGPQGNGVFSERKLPYQWSEEANIVWKKRIPGRGWSQPVVAGDKIFVTSAICENEETPRRFERGIIPDARDARQDEYQWKLFCLSADNGEILWGTLAYMGKPAAPKHRSNTYASESPATDGKVVVCHFGTKGVNCYDMTGKPLWNKHLGEFPTQAGWGTGSSPVIYENSVLIQCDNSKSSFLVSLDKNTGNELWRIARDEKSNWSTPCIWKNKLRTEMVVAGGKKMISYDLNTREVLWEMAASGRTSITPVADDDQIYVDSFHNIHGSPGILAAVRVGASGDISLKDDATSNEFVAWSVNLKSYRNSSPVVCGGGIYTLDQNSGIIRCFDTKTGELRFQERMSELAGCTASPWTNDGKVFVMDETGLTLALRPGKKAEVLATNRLNDDMFWASAAAHGDRLLLRGMNHLYCIK